MKVFLSWSGSLSHRVARTLRDWLPSVIQSLRPYVSSQDIDKGARWSTDIAKELEEASYGIVCVTRENLEAPWVHFEAGALSKSLDKANVVPFLFDVKRSDVQGPLLQFQSVIYGCEEIDKLLRGMNKRVAEEDRLSDEHLARAFEVWWPQLKDRLDQLKEEQPSSSKKPRSATRPREEEILEELLELGRNTQRLLNSPEVLLPQSYLRSLLGQADAGEARRFNRLQRELEKLHSEVIELEPQFAALAKEHPECQRIVERLERLHRALHMAMDKSMHFQSGRPWHERWFRDVEQEGEK